MKTIRSNFLDKKLIGTLFEEEEIGKKDNWNNQVAKDEKGRKHWHGAFTGGFQAGYKNTCGSRDGWAPQTFLSSRTNRAQIQQQSVDTFMDEEDVGKQQIGVNLTIAEEFDSFGVSQLAIIAQKLGANNVLGYAPSEIMYKQNKSIGYQLLHEMRLKNKIEKREKNYDIELPEEDEAEIQQVEKTVQSNDDFYGLGFKAKAEPSTATGTESLFLTFMKKFSNAPDEFDEVKRKKDNRITFNGEGNEEKEEFNFEMNEPEEDLGQQPKKKVKQNMIMDRKVQMTDVFVKAPQQLHIPETTYTIDVPPDFDPHYRLKGLVKQGFDLNKLLMKKKEDPRKRRQLFEEDELILKEQDASSIRQDIDRKKFVRGGNDIGETAGVKELFPFDKEKQKRFEHFTWERQGKMVSGIPPTNHLNQEQLEEEKLEFERMYMMFQTQSKHVLNQPVQPKAQPKVDDPKAAFYCKRRARKWVPQGMVSMRLGVPSPYTEEEAYMINKQNKKSKEPKEKEAKERFRSGGVYKEGEEQILDPSLLISRFDPSQLGLPLSFKSMSMERSQRDMQRLMDQQAQSLPPRETKQDRRQQEMEEPLQQGETRAKDQSLFDAIFGDD